MRHRTAAGRRLLVWAMRASPLDGETLGPAGGGGGNPHAVVSGCGTLVVTGKTARPKPCHTCWLAWPCAPTAGWIRSGLPACASTG